MVKSNVLNPTPDLALSKIETREVRRALSQTLLTMNNT